jgi:hypothetical protein
MYSSPFGRPRTLDTKRQRELLDLIHHGSSVEEAAQVVGVSLRTVQRLAKADEFFDHDLQLALQCTSVDCEKLVLQAARTHWRAAAWVLERRDPDHYAKRPPNSCSPETLLDVMAWLIETALEATPPEHREAVFRRTHAAADKAFNSIRPGFSHGRPAAERFGVRPTPLSDQEIVKTWRDPKNALIRTDRDAEAPLLPFPKPSAAAAEDPTGLLSPKMSASDKSPDDKCPATDVATTQNAETGATGGAGTRLAGEAGPGSDGTCRVEVRRDVRPQVHMRDPSADLRVTKWPHDLDAPRACEIPRHRPR